MCIRDSLKSVNNNSLKIWEELEKLKTYYMADKKKSLKIVIDKISKEDADMTDTFNCEFDYLTKFGNTH